MNNNRRGNLYYNDGLPERAILGAALNSGMNSIKAETSR